MAHFINKPKVLQLTDKWYQLQDDLVFTCTLNELLVGYKPTLKDLVAKGINPDDDIYVICPTGFITDLASVPESLRWIFPVDGEYMYAAIMHDMAYQSLKEETFLPTAAYKYHPIQELNIHHTRYMADCLFLLGMRDLGVGVFTRTAMYNGVRLGGASSYGGAPMEEDYGLLMKHKFNLVDCYQIYREKPSQGVEPSFYRVNKPEIEGAVFIKYPNLKRSFAF